MERFSNTDKDELLKEAYLKKEYTKCLEILEAGASGTVNLQVAVPLLYDLYTQYENVQDEEIEKLFLFYLKNRKGCFESSIAGVYGAQTVGSYIAHFGSLRVFKIIAGAQININSPYEKAEETALFNVASKMKGYRVPHRIFGELDINEKEKKERLKLLLDAGASATLRRENQRTIFHDFKWWPEEEDFTEILDKMIACGADIQGKDNSSNTAIYTALYPYALNQNAEAYIRYLINRGVSVTQDDISRIIFVCSAYQIHSESDNKDANINKLERIRELLIENL
jgi:hypothetical protein